MRGRRPAGPAAAGPDVSSVDAAQRAMARQQLRPHASAADTDRARLRAAPARACSQGSGSARVGKPPARDMARAEGRCSSSGLEPRACAVCMGGLQPCAEREAAHRKTCHGPLYPHKLPDGPPPAAEVNRAVPTGKDVVCVGDSDGTMTGSLYDPRGGGGVPHTLSARVTVGAAASSARQSACRARAARAAAAEAGGRRGA